jgi:hypothetical protein
MVIYGFFYKYLGYSARACKRQNEAIGSSLSHVIFTFGVENMGLLTCRFGFSPIARLAGLTYSRGRVFTLISKDSKHVPYRYLTSVGVEACFNNILFFSIDQN